MPSRIHHQSSDERAYGLHDWSDRHGNVGSEVLSRHDFHLRTVQVDGLFDPSHNHKTGLRMHDYFHPAGNPKRRVFVVMDGQLPSGKQLAVEQYFLWAKQEQLLDDYRILPYVASSDDKTLQQVIAVVTAAKHFGLKRRDLLLGIGPTTLTDIVGFAAAMYRRSASWMCVPSNKEGFMAAQDPNRQISVDHVTHQGRKHPALLAFWHPPIATFYDPVFSGAHDEPKAADASTEHQWKRWYESHYHVASVPRILDKDNTTVIEEYCAQNPAGRKQKILLVADDYPGNSITAVQAYFQHHRSSIEEIRTLRVDTASCRKNVDSMREVLDAAIAMDLTEEDLFLVVGGGTIMDIVGFAASMYKGGSRYLKVPTTLLGMIDAGIAVKVGVNLGDHKNFIGRYHAPVACLNDPATFLPTLPPREFSSGLAEAIKMALLKSSHLFHLIALHDGNVRYNQYTDEVVQISVVTMLEELQPNLHEHDLRRTVDFGHEFGHIIEGLAHHQIPHGECVAIGMAISSWIAYLKGILSWADLKKILDLSLNLGLPIYATDYDCCNPHVLWEKIRSDGISQKNGMLWLVVPAEDIGKATFIDEIPEINADMVRNSILGLQRYAAWYNGRCFMKPDASHQIGPTANRTGDLKHTHVPFDPAGIRLPIASQTRSVLEAALAKIQATLQQTAASDDDVAYDSLPQESWAVPLIDDAGTEPLSQAQSNAIQEVFSRYPGFGGTLKGVCLRNDGVIFAQFDAGPYPLQNLRNDVSKAMDLVAAPIADHGPSIALARIRQSSIDATKAGAIEPLIEQEFFHSSPAELHISHAVGPDGQVFSFSESQPPTPDSLSRTPESTPGTPESLATTPGAMTPLPVELPKAAKVTPAFTMRPELHVLTVDVGATYFRIAVLGASGHLLGAPVRIPAPSRQSFPRDSLSRLQERLLETLVREIDHVRASQPVALEEVAVSFGAVIDSQGIVQDASVLWGEPARGFDFKTALGSRLPGARLTVLNDISAAAWRYKDEGRFCLITVSSGLSNKVFNPDLRTLDRLDLDVAGIGGEMGHVVVEPRAVDALVLHAITRASNDWEAFRASRLYIDALADAKNVTAKHLRTAVKERDAFALRLLEEADVPCCPCGNFADLCSYSSGRGALIQAKRLATNGEYGVTADDVTDVWLKQGIDAAHPLAMKALQDATYPLAWRILQLAADIGLNKFIIVGGFAMKTGRQAYMQSLQHHLVRLCHNSAYFADWTNDDIHRLVQFGADDDSDGLIGMGYYVQHLRSHYCAVEKAIGESSQCTVTRAIPGCGTQEVLAKVLFSGICTTDLEILRGQRGYEPNVLGHEGVCQVVEVGSAVKGLGEGAIIVINPNNPLDDHDKLGHTKEGVFQQYVKFGQESLDRNQILILDGTSASPTDTLIEPLSCVLAAQENVPQHVSGKTILVVGAGVMGLMFALMSQKNGAANVLLVNRSKEKLDFAMAKGVVNQEQAFAADNATIASHVKQRTAGTGVDTVFVCVGNGCGESAAQAALEYVNPGGCVYLFSGFRGGDALSLPNGQRLDILSIRSTWKTKQVKFAAKTVDLSGNRGSRVEHLLKASRLIRQNTLFFSKVISHVVSLDTLPNTMLSLAKDRKLLGQPAKRVVIDMDARDGLVESADGFTLRQLHQATRRRQTAIPAGNPFRQIGFDGDKSQLGWVLPPTWQEIEALFNTVLSLRSFHSKRHFVFCGTGPWAWVVDALRETTHGSSDVSIHTIQSLDPQALREMFSSIGSLSEALVLGISQSGTTLETVTLMNTLRERFDSGALNVQDHFAWITDARTSTADVSSGEATVNACGWNGVDIVPLTVGNYADINALFCAPHSTVALLTLLLAHRKDIEAVRHVYQEYLALRQGVSRELLPKAYSFASNGAERIQLVLDDKISTPAMTRLATQLIQQALGSKQQGFNPRVRVGLPCQLPGFETLQMPLQDGCPAVVEAMLTMNALAVFVAMMAAHRQMEFVTHPKVNLYKRRTKELLNTATTEPQHACDREAVAAQIIAYLGKNPGVTFLDLVLYGEASAARREETREWLASRISAKIPSAAVEVYNGEEFNHSAYQAAVQNEDSLYVLLESKEACEDVHGISQTTIHSNVRLLRAIAQSTAETLGPKALYFVV